MTHTDVEFMPNRTNLKARKRQKRILGKQSSVFTVAAEPVAGTPEGCDVRRLQIYERSVYLSKIQVFVCVCVCVLVDPRCFGGRSNYFRYQSGSGEMAVPTLRAVPRPRQDTGCE